MSHNYICIYNVSMRIPFYLHTLQGTESTYGFARMLVSGKNRIDYSFVDMAGEEQDRFAIVKT